MVTKAGVNAGLVVLVSLISVPVAGAGPGVSSIVTRVAGQSGWRATEETEDLRLMRC